MPLPGMGGLTFFQTVMLHILTVTPATLLGVAAIWKVVQNGRHSKNEFEASKQAVQDIHMSINSRMDQFLEAAQKLGHAEGQKQEAEKRDAKAANISEGRQAERDSK